MTLVPAQCTQCGGQIEVDDSKEAGICKHCGMPFITEKAINNYTTVHNVTNHVTKIINGQEVEDGEDFYNRAMSHLKLEEYSDAKEAIAKAIKKNPDNAEFRYAEILIETKNLTDFGNVFDGKKIENLLKVANKKSKDKWTKETGFDFSNTKASLFMSVIQKAIDTANFQLVGSTSNYFNKLKQEECITFLETKEMIECFNTMVKSLMDYKDEDLLTWFEKLFGLAVYYELYTKEYRYAIVRAYIEVVKMPHIDVGKDDVIQKGNMLLITEDNYKLFMKKQETLCVPYQQVDFVRLTMYKTNPPILDFEVTPNIYNYKQCETYDADGGPVAYVAVVDYDEDDVEILKQTYDITKLKYNNKKVLKDKKRSKKLNTKSGRFFEQVKDFVQTLFQGVLIGLSVLLGLCVVLPFVGAIFKLVESNDLWAWVFKWALIGAGITTVIGTVYLILKEYLEKRKKDKKLKK